MELNVINGMVVIFNKQMGIVKPLNPMSEFIAGQIPLFFPADLGDVQELVTKMLVNTTNNEPEMVNKKIVDFLNAYKVWYRENSNVQM